MSYLRGDELLTACRAGRGRIVMVEGETQQDDPYFYQRWFGDQATAISFFAQNGWQQVERSVAELRGLLPERAIFGIIDRDLTPQHVIDAQYEQVPADGIFRTTCYTLENYFFNPQGWQRVIYSLHRHAPPEGWREVTEIAQRIEECCQEMLPVAAYNWVVRSENARCPGMAGRKDKTHVQQMQQFDPGELSPWGQGRGCGEDLGQAYLQRLGALQRLPKEEWHLWLNGKYLLENAWLPRIPKGGSIGHQHLVSLYLDQCPEPPDGLERLISRILAVSV